MITQELINYIDSQKQLGKNNEEIKQVLVVGGWQESVVDQAFNLNENEKIIIPPPSGVQLYEKSNKHKKMGMFLIIGPFVGLVIVMVSFGLSAFILDAIGTGMVGSQIVNIVLGFLGIICVLGILFGIPLGIVLLNKKVLLPNVKYDTRSGNGDMSVIPNEIKGWNWGAAGLTWIWGLYYNVWISLLCFIPIVNIAMTLVLGFKGSEWAWRKQKWLNVAEFRQSQDKWKIWGIVFFMLFLLSIFNSIGGILLILQALSGFY